MWRFSAAVGGFMPQAYDDSHAPIRRGSMARDAQAAQYRPAPAQSAHDDPSPRCIAERNIRVGIRGSSAECSLSQRRNGLEGFDLGVVKFLELASFILVESVDHIAVLRQPDFVSVR